MDLKAIGEVFATGESAENKKTALVANSTLHLLSVLKQSFPMTGDIFDSIGSELRRQLDKVETEELSEVKYFTGHGPVATKVREHLTLFLALDKALDKADSAEKGLEPVVTESRLWGEKTIQAFLDKCDFKPTQIKHFISPLQIFFGTLPGRLNEDLHVPLVFKSMPFARLTNKDALESGIYRDSNEVTQIVLRVEIPNTDGVIALYCSPHPKNLTAPELYFYHPYERMWLRSEWRITFPDLQELFQKEFTKVLTATQPIDRNFDFQNELDKLNSGLVTQVFDDAALFPDQLYYGDNDILTERSVNIGMGMDLCVIRKSEVKEDKSYDVTLVVRCSSGGTVRFKRAIIADGPVQTIDIQDYDPVNSPGKVTTHFTYEVQLLVLRRLYAFTTALSGYAALQKTIRVANQ